MAENNAAPLPTKIEDPKPQVDGEDITGDGGVIKKVLKAGSGWDRPKGGAEVEVHYVGTLLNGEKFDSSRDRNEPFKFKLRSGSVIKGWDEAVESMQKGELARFTLKPEYAYGASGAPPKIGPDATLMFEIELLNWNDEKDISKKTDGSLMKKVLQEASGWERPKGEGSVKIHFTVADSEGKVLDESFSKQSGKVLEYRVGSGEVSKALDRIVKDMKKGELCRARAAAGEHLVGGTLTKVLPANAAVVYTVELVDHVNEKEPHEMTNEEKFSFSAKRREDGNAFFKQGLWKRAAKRYKSALSCVKSDHSFNPEEKQKGKEQQLLCLLNQAACSIKLQKWKDVIDQTTKALEIEASNPKAHFRRAQAHMTHADYDLAEKDLNRALEKQPGDKEVIALLNKCKAQQKLQDQKDKAIFAKMMAVGK